ncbi:hypothetical protein EMCG_02122 [[Emmonsia] crescens]|uniref:BZIP domain-containing protein n=1 Tax=[Emmonsia] crescens TaxID=73230 RepID=A0A0G2I0D3_9EURO|nr:hypothetical protein EMCG_02122 [Emmonsia crescens UAMH 3008]
MRAHPAWSMRRNASNANHYNINATPSGFRVRDDDESLYFQTHYQSLPSVTSASVYSTAPATAAATSSSSSSPASSRSSASLRQPYSLSYHQYIPQHDNSTQLSGEDNPPLNYHLPSDSLALPLCSEEFVSQVQTVTTTATASTSPWPGFLELNYDLNQDDQSLRSSLLLPAKTSLQTETASTLSNPLSDVPVPAAIPEYDLLYPYSKGDELDVDELLYLMSAQDSFETTTQPDRQFCLPDYNHPSNNVQQHCMPTSQSIDHQDINRPQPHQLHIATPSQSQSEVPTHHFQPKPSSPQLPTSPTPSGTHTHHSTPSSTQIPRSPAAVATATSMDRVTDKRRRNTLAARRFRQKQQDRVAELEQALESVCKERDELKMQAARWEGEAAALRGMLRKNS